MSKTVRVGIVPDITRVQCQNHTDFSCSAPGLNAELMLTIAQALNWSMEFVLMTNLSYNAAVDDFAAGRIDITTPDFVPTLERIAEVDFIPQVILTENVAFLFTIDSLHFGSELKWFNVFSKGAWMVLLASIAYVHFLQTKCFHEYIYAFLLAQATVWFAIFIYHIIFETLLRSKMMLTYEVPLITIREGRPIIGSGFQLAAWQGTYWSKLAQYTFGKGFTDSIIYINDVGKLVSMGKGSKPVIYVTSNRFANAVERKYGDWFIRSPQLMENYTLMETCLLPYDSPLKQDVSRTVFRLLSTGIVQMITNRYDYRYRVPAMLEKKTHVPLAIHDFKIVFAGIFFAPVIGLFVGFMCPTV